MQFTISINVFSYRHTLSNVIKIQCAQELILFLYINKMIAVYNMYELSYISDFTNNVVTFVPKQSRIIIDEDRFYKKNFNLLQYNAFYKRAFLYYIVKLYSLTSGPRIKNSTYSTLYEHNDLQILIVLIMPCTV